MNANHQKNLKEVIDVMCENLVRAWNYFHTLEGLQEQAKTQPDTISRFPSLFANIHFALWDALILRLNHFIDRTKRGFSFHRLFKLIRQYLPEEKRLLNKVSADEKRLLSEGGIVAEKIEKWRNQVVAHLSPASRNPHFYQENKLHLIEVKKFLLHCGEVIEVYSDVLLSTRNDTISGSLEPKREIAQLFRMLRTEPPAAVDRS